MAKKILIVEDDAALAAVYGELLRLSGYETAVSADGQAALYATDKKQFDVVILDLLLPGVSGIDILKALRESYSAYREVPIIVVTNMGYDQVVSDALRVGANAILLKASSTASEVVAKVKELCPQDADPGAKPS